MRPAISTSRASSWVSSSATASSMVHGRAMSCSAYPARACTRTDFRWPARSSRWPTASRRTKHFDGWMSALPSLAAGTLGEALLETHRPYYRMVSPVLERVHGIAHITGGGYTENVPQNPAAGAHGSVRNESLAGAANLPAHRASRRNIPRRDVRSVQHGHRARAHGLPGDSRKCATHPGSAQVGPIVPNTGSRVELVGL